MWPSTATESARSRPSVRTRHAVCEKRNNISLPSQKNCLCLYIYMCCFFHVWPFTFVCSTFEETNTQNLLMDTTTNKSPQKPGAQAGAQLARLSADLGPRRPEARPRRRPRGSGTRSAPRAPPRRPSRRRSPSPWRPPRPRWPAPSQPEEKAWSLFSVAC